jgi:uncharacterized membrane protein YuzA (DUF378 family)
MFNIYINLIAKVVLILGGINYLFMALANTDLFSLIKMPMLTKTMFILIGLSALYFMFNRDYYLPFLGETVIPVSNTNTQSNTTPTSSIANSSMTPITLSGLPPNTRIMYWAAQKSDDVFDNPIKAYSTYANMGITNTDRKGGVSFSINCPAEYKVPKFGFSTKLKKHVHYRYELPGKPGMFSRIHTHFIANC